MTKLAHYQMSAQNEVVGKRMLSSIFHACMPPIISPAEACHCHTFSKSRAMTLFWSAPEPTDTPPPPSLVI